jgi:hypothetical protein
MSEHIMSTIVLILFIIMMTALFIATKDAPTKPTQANIPPSPAYTELNDTMNSIRTIIPTIDSLELGPDATRLLIHIENNIGDLLTQTTRITTEQQAQHLTLTAKSLLSQLEILKQTNG